MTSTEWQNEKTDIFQVATKSSLSLRFTSAPPARLAVHRAIDLAVIPVGKKDILIRMLVNLTSIARREEDLPGLLRYESAILTIDPNLIEDRLLRAAARVLELKRLLMRTDDR